MLSSMFPKYLLALITCDSYIHSCRLFLPLNTELQMSKESRKIVYVSRVLHKDNPSLFSDSFVGIYHATVCLSLLITGNQDSGVFVIPMCDLFFLPCCQTVNTSDVWRVRKWGIKHPHKFAKSNWTPPWKIFSLLMVCRLDREYVINE